MLLRMGLLLRLGPNVITDGTFITLGSNYYTCAFYNLLFIDLNIVHFLTLTVYPMVHVLLKGNNYLLQLLGTMSYIMF